MMLKRNFRLHIRAADPAARIANKTDTLSRGCKLLYTVSQKKLGHFNFYCNFGKCWPIFKILSLSESEINGS